MKNRILALAVLCIRGCVLGNTSCPKLLDMNKSSSSKKIRKTFKSLPKNREQHI